MRRPIKSANFALAASLLGVSMLSASALATNTTIEMGKEVAYDRTMGNCLACQMMDDGASPGDIGPPLIAMKIRFPDRAKLRAQIWDAQTSNPGTRMPPFGKHQALWEMEIDAIVDYLHTL